MPIYEYRCQDCGHELEKLQRMSDAPLVDCPSCGKAGLQRLISAAGFRLKGGGWYETDFKQGQKRNLADGSEGKKESKADSAPASGGDSKPAAATETKAKPESGAKKAAPTVSDS